MYGIEVKLSLTHMVGLAMLNLSDGDIRRLCYEGDGSL